MRKAPPIDTTALHAALDQARQDLDTPTWTQVAEAVGTSPAALSRLKAGKAPSPELHTRMLTWLGSLTVDGHELPAGHDTGCADCGICDTCGLSSSVEDDAGADAVEGVAAIWATQGQLSDSEDPETVASVTRVRELLAEGAVGVSIAWDMDPDTMPDHDAIEAAEQGMRDARDEDQWQEAYEAYAALMEGVLFRVRHVAVVDTPAFADAYLAEDADGNVTGPITFEGTWTGDQRWLNYGRMTWDPTKRIPIIWDRQDGDHTGVTVGWVTALERRDGETTAQRPVTAALTAPTLTGLGAITLADFAITPPAKAVPLRITAPDHRGFRAIEGHIVPKGTCHRSGDGYVCRTYPGDADPTLSGFHTGLVLPTADGGEVRCGALTMAGLHLDATIRDLDTAKRALREDTRQTFALVRGAEDAHGLYVRGILVPGLSDKQIFQAAGATPSVELWPHRRGGLTLVGAHLVPEGAWPVAASLGSAQVYTEGTPVQIDPVPAPAVADLAEVTASLGRLEWAVALLVADKLT